MALARLAPGGVVATAGETLALGDVLILDTSGEALKAAASFAGGNWRVFASAKGAAVATATVFVGTSGSFSPVRFSAAPAAASNGSLVYLSTTSGEGTLTAPSASGNVIFVVGILQGADGVSTTPDVLLQPQYISRIP